MGAIRRKEVTNVCETCGTGYWVPPYRRERTRYCCASCRGSAIAAKHLNNGPKPWAAANLDGHRHKSSSKFKSGHTPWNKGLKGIHLSPETEFKAGCESRQKLPMGSVTIRTDGNGKPRAWLKTNDGWRPRAQVVYEAKHGAIPVGKVVHHVDGDTLNDRADNLVALTPSQHIYEHLEDLLGARDL